MPIARASIATPSATMAQLDMPSPKTMTKAAMVPTTAATSLRAGAIGRPLWFATVDLLGTTSQVTERCVPVEGRLPLAAGAVPIG